ncbi:hypothetical protein O1611_g1049 [Lasiodiplodia mahajangana]|uniref:Uncharacterized protein n=1 Tax=Lasiodiplodia mahajangana TaxID=1108764 RepID=A0ACC2JZ38_9PEZI|nr:hypothetical protein O1611_g1049 [Lasiodiplodia mahajangana]
MASVTHQTTGGIVATATNKNPIIQAVTWLLLGLSSLVVIFWVLTKFYIKTRALFVLGDALMLGSYLFALGESIALITPSSIGFGRDISELSAEQISDTAKASSSDQDKAHHRWAHVLVVSVAIWMITSVFGTAFQCGARGPWDKASASCIDQDAFLKYVDITSILIDAGLVALPIAIIYPLRMPLRLRLTVISFFLFRIIVIAATITQLAYLRQLWTENYTLLAFPYYISMQLVLFISLVAAYIIYFWPLMRSMQSGLMSANASMLTSQYPLTRGSKGTQKSSQKSTTLKTVTTSHLGKDGYIEIVPSRSPA